MDPTLLSSDFREFLKSLNDAGVEYLVVGGHAVAYYGYVRPTRDIDIWVAISSENAEKLVTAVRSFFGTDLPGLDKSWFLDPENVTHFGAVPYQIEILSKVSGGNFSQAYARKSVAELDGLRINFIGLEDLKTNKRASGRFKDLADLENLP